MKRLIVLAGLVGLSSCGGDPVNAEGTYTINVTNRENGCNFANWTVGESASNIQVVINQQDTNVNADVMGVTRIYLDAILGSHVFEGIVDGNCKVFGQENLYVAGSSVFPTGGYCNPTLSIVQLALRLGGHLRAIA